jgi:hypothetical protein
MVYDYATIASELFVLSELFTPPSMIACFIMGIVMAFFGYKIFRTFLRATFAIGGGVVAYVLFTFNFPINGYLPQVLELNWAAVFSLVAAILCAILAPYIYKFVAGFMVGDFLGACVMVILGVENEIAVLVVSIIVGILFGLLFTKIFKALYILGTSFSGTILAGFSLGVVLCPETFNYMFAETMKTYYSQLGAASADIQMALEDVGLANLSAPASDMGALLFGALIILGIVVGIVATIVQFKKCKEI